MIDVNLADVNWWMLSAFVNAGLVAAMLVLYIRASRDLDRTEDELDRLRAVIIDLETWATDDPEYRLIRAADEDRIRAVVDGKAP